MYCTVVQIVTLAFVKLHFTCSLHTATPLRWLLVISANLPEIRSLLLHKIRWKSVMVSINKKRFVLFFSSSTLGKLWRKVWGVDMWRVPCFVIFCDRIVIQQMVFARFVVVFSTLGKLWRERRGGWYVEGPLWLTSQGTATSVSTPQLLLLNKIQRQLFFYKLLVGYHKYNASKILEKKITIHSFFQIITLMV